MGSSYTPAVFFTAQTLTAAQAGQAFTNLSPGNGATADIKLDSTAVDRSIIFKTAGGTASIFTQSVNDKLVLAAPAAISITPLGSGAGVQLGLATAVGTAQSIHIQANGTATSGATTITSHFFDWNSRYWTGSASADVSIRSQATTDTSGNATLTFSTTGTTLAIALGTTTIGANLNTVATLGSELAPALTAGNWTVGSGWESPIVGPGLIKNADGTGTQTPSAATNIVAGTTYKVVITLSALSAGSASYTLGGTPGPSSLAGVTTYTDYVTANTTGKLIITPTNTARFTISAISITALTASTGGTTIDGPATLRSPADFKSYATVALGGNAVGASIRPTGGSGTTGFNFVTPTRVQILCGGITVLNADYGASHFINDAYGGNLAWNVATRQFCNSSGTAVLTVSTTNFQFAEAYNMLFGETTGTKIGTATSQKIGFWNVAPITQPTTGVAAATFVANTSLISNDTATFDGYTIGQVVKALRNIGLLQ